MSMTVCWQPHSYDSITCGTMGVAAASKAPAPEPSAPDEEEEEADAPEPSPCCWWDAAP